MTQLSRVLFPNPFGEIPADAAVTELEERFAFSTAYAAFLRTQNGFRFFALEEGADRQRYLTMGADSETTLDIAQLFTVAELPAAQHRIRALGKWFFSIGKGYGGDQYAEVLHGNHRGSIVHLNHEVFLGTSSFEQIAENYDNFEEYDVDFFELSVSSQADFLVDTVALDLAAKVASSAEEFVASCIQCDPAGFLGRCVPRRA